MNTTAPIGELLEPPQPDDPKRRRKFWSKGTVAIILSSLALLLSLVAVSTSASQGPAGPRGPQGTQGQQGVQGQQGQQGPRGERGRAGTTGAAGASSQGSSGGGSGNEPGISPATNQRQQACIDTYTGTLSAAQINQYCAPGGILY